MTNEELQIKKDRMRYIKNTLSANLALLAIVFNVFCFVSIYQTDVGSFYYRIIIGVSIVYNLIFMLAAFLSSEGIKNYNATYSYVLAVLGILQFVRIFLLPTQAHSTLVAENGGEVLAMSNGKFNFVVACLVISGVCCLASAAVGYLRSRTLQEYIASLDKAV